MLQAERPAKLILVVFSQRLRGTYLFRESASFFDLFAGWLLQESITIVSIATYSKRAGFGLMPAVRRYSCAAGVPAGAFGVLAHAFWQHRLCGLC